VTQPAQKARAAAGGFEEAAHLVGLGGLGYRDSSKTKPSPFALLTVLSRVSSTVPR